MTTATASDLKQPREFQLGSTWRGPSGVLWEVVEETKILDGNNLRDASPAAAVVKLRRLSVIAGIKGPNTLARRKLAPLSWKFVSAGKG